MAEAMPTVIDQTPAPEKRTATGLSTRAAREQLQAQATLQRDALFGIAWSYLGNREEALDACQEAISKALKNAHRFDPDQSMSAWLARILRNVCLDRLRRLKLRRHASIEQRRIDGLPDPQTPRTGPLGLLLQDELRDEIRQAMTVLRDEEREVLFLREVLEWPYARIESYLDLSHGTVASLIHRARQRLREQLAEYVKHGSSGTKGERSS